MNMNTWQKICIKANYKVYKSITSLKQWLHNKMSLASCWKHGVQHENNHGLSEGSTTKMSQNLHSHGLNGTKGEKLHYVQTFDKKIFKKKKKDSRTISKLVKTPIHKTRFESKWFYDVNARKYHEITLIWWVKDVGINQSYG